MQKLQKIIVLLFLFSNQFTFSVTIVYNLRVAGTARRQALTENKPGPNISVIAPFAAFRQRYNGGKQKIGGALGTYAHIKPPWYFKVDFAAARVTECTAAKTYFARTQTDDILFSGGYILRVKDRAKFAFTGILGIPTHKSFELEPIQFGIGHVGVGAQLDGSYVYSQNMDHSIIGALRLVHFLPRNTSVLVSSACQTFNIHLGNTLDVFMSHHSNFGKNTIEFGYDPIFNFGAYATPFIQAIQDNKNVIRNTFFAYYQRFFTIKKHPSAVLAGVTYAFDKKSTDIGFKNSTIVWAGWGISF